MIQKEFIRSELRYRYPDLTDHIRAPQQQVGRPLLFETGARNFGARIIICTAAEFDSLSKFELTEPLFLCIGVPGKKSIDHCDFCVLPEYEQVGAVLNFVQRLFDRLDDWTQSLRQAAETGVDAEELLVRASEMLQNPVVLLDERAHIVAQSERSDSSALAKYVAIVTSQQEADDRNMIKTFGEENSPDALFSFFQSGEARYTLLCMASNRPLYASDEIVFDSLSGFLRLMLSQRTLRMGDYRKFRENEAAEEAFQMLLSRDQPEHAAIEKLDLLGWKKNFEYTVLAIEPEDGELRAAHADAICDALESALEGCCAFALLPVIAAVVKTELIAEKSFLDHLRKIVSEQELRIGVCEPYEGFAFFAQRFSQAKRALNRAAKSGGVACYADDIEREIASQSIAEYTKELVCMRSVLALARFDRTHGTSYQETTEQYVKNRFNAVKTAGGLFIHRSTFLYRLERIKAQFGLDLEDAELSLLHLLLSLQIAKEI